MDFMAAFRFCWIMYETIKLGKRKQSDLTKNCLSKEGSTSELI